VVQPRVLSGNGPVAAIPIAGDDDPDVAFPSADAVPVEDHHIEEDAPVEEAPDDWGDMPGLEAELAWILENCPDYVEGIVEDLGALGMCVLLAAHDMCPVTRRCSR
jgi:hypothetical protein